MLVVLFVDSSIPLLLLLHLAQSIPQQLFPRLCAMHERFMSSLTESERLVGSNGNALLVYVINKITLVLKSGY